MQVSQAQHHRWFRNKVLILYSECHKITYSLADWQLKTKMDWNNSTLAGKVNTLKQRLQFKVHEMVNNTVRSVIFPLTLLQWSNFLPLLIITFQSVLPVHLVLDLFVLRNCCCRHFRSIFFLVQTLRELHLCSMPRLHPYLSSAFCSMLRPHLRDSVVPSRPAAWGSHFFENFSVLPEAEELTLLLRLWPCSSGQSVYHTYFQAHSASSLCAPQRSS